MQIPRKSADEKLLLAFAVCFYWQRILHGSKKKEKEKRQRINEFQKIVFNGQTSSYYTGVYIFVECQDLHEQITLLFSKLFLFLKAIPDLSVTTNDIYLKIL